MRRRAKPDVAIVAPMLIGAVEPAILSRIEPVLRRRRAKPALDADKRTSWL